MRHILRFLYWSGRVTLILYFIIGLTWLGLRYAVLPYANQWRDTIAQQLSQTLGAQVAVARIDAQWLGLLPSLNLHEVSIADPQGGHMHLPYLHARISWRSLIAWRLQFSRLEVVGLDLSVRRDAQGQLWFLDYALGHTRTDKTDDNVASYSLASSMAWLLSHAHIDFSDVTLRWIDAQRQAPALVLQRMHLSIHQQGDMHQVHVSLTPPAPLANTVELRAEFQTADLHAHALDLSQWRGRIYARADAVQAAAWRPWFDVPELWHKGLLGLQASAELRAGTLADIAVDMRLHDGQWSGENQFSVDHARLSLEGAWPAMAQWMTEGAAVPSHATLRFRVQLAGLRAQLPTVFDDPLQFETLAFSGQVGTNSQGLPAITLDVAQASNADMAVTWQGDWRATPDTVAGHINWQGRFARLDVSAIARYLPKVVNADTRAWMRVGLLDGQIQDADFVLQGDLMQFPFGDAPNAGDFSLQGRVINGVIDYAATAEGDLPWPRLDAIDGSLRMQRVTLALQARRASMSTGQGLKPIILSDLYADIPNIERNPQLTVRGKSQAPAASYLGLMRNSPLGARLDHVFAQATGVGQWQVPLTLVVPLLHSLDLTVDGQVQFMNASLQLMPEMPPFTALQGSIAFTHEYIRAPQLSATFLGDVVTLSGGIGEQQPGLLFTGHITSEALRDYVGVQGMDRFQGRAAYRAQLQRSASRGFALDVQSDLQGMALHLPAPLNKPADQALRLQAHWGDDTQTNRVRQQALQVQLGDNVHVRLLRRPEEQGESYFYAGALVEAQPMPKPLLPGMHVDARTALSDAAAWNRVADAFSQPLDEHSSARRSLLPALQSLRVQSEQMRLFGLNLQQAVLDAQHKDANLWQIHIQSPETAGTLLWHNADDDAKGYIHAQFERLSIGASAIASAPDEQEDDSAQDIQEALDIPSLDLHVRAFTLYDYPLGELSVTGVQQPKAWALESLRIVGAGLTMEGRGLWNLRGAQRGLNLDVLATVSDMGAYLEQLGLTGVMRQGQGNAHAQLFWRDLPWRLDTAQVQGKINIDLEKGRFSQVNSYTARLLELLSIQSLQRLVSMDWNLDALTREGFPFDVLRGDIALQNGRLYTKDYQVIGPVGAIAIDGRVDLEAKNQDLRAAVIPNLDMSGTAIAAGIAINPVIGLGALLTQWLLKKPIENAMAIEYHVGGTWEEPKIQEVSRHTPQRARSFSDSVQ